MSRKFQLQNPETALRWCDIFRILGFKPGLEYWAGMNLRLLDRQVQCVYQNAVKAAHECEKPMPAGGERSPREEYLPSRQLILDGFMANVAADCGQPALKELLAWAEYDYGVDPEDGRDEFQWFETLIELRNESEIIRPRIGIEQQLMEQITHLIEGDILSPFLSLKEKFNKLCDNIEDNEGDAEACRNRFTSIHLLITNINVRRCWGEIRTLLARDEQDAIFDWYHEARKTMLAKFPQFDREISPMRQ